MSEKKHSPAFNTAAKEYKAGRWSKAMLKVLVERGRITAQEYEEITGEDVNA